MPNAQTNYKFINPTTHVERWASSPDLWSIWNIEIPSSKHNLKTMQDFFNNSLAPEKKVEVKLTDTNLANTEVDKIPFLKDLNKLYGKMLIINLKRFKYEKFAAKKGIRIEEPFNLVIKKEQTADLTRDTLYRLVGFIKHSGNTGGGHYITYTNVDDKWILYSDSNVKEIAKSTAEAVAKEAYLFFYQPA